MLQIRTILVPTDGSPNARRATRIAADLGRRIGAAIHLLSIYETVRANPIQAMFQSPSADREALFEHLTDERSHLEQQGIPVHEIRRDAADVAAEILLYASESEADLIVMGGHGRSVLGRLRMGGTADEVVRRAEAAVMVVRESDDIRPDEGLALRHVLTPVDFSSDAEAAVPVAREIARLYGASLSLLYIAESRVVPVFSDTGLFTVNTVEPDEDVDQRAAQALEQIVREGVGPDVETQYHVRRGHAAREILDFARNKDVDLILLSLHGVGAHGLFGMGSVAERIVDRATVPVLTLKPPSQSLLRRDGER